MKYCTFCDTEATQVAERIMEDDLPMCTTCASAFEAGARAGVTAYVVSIDDYEEGG